ncbi:hypothetical protein SNEBB_010884 [Seison nebaliae]|nr:hypothetical protein SNEBB_010884 [Seison nebaliae]
MLIRYRSSRILFVRCRGNPEHLRITGQRIVLQCKSLHFPSSQIGFFQETAPKEYVMIGDFIKIPEDYVFIHPIRSITREIPKSIVEKNDRIVLVMGSRSNNLTSVLPYDVVVNKKIMKYISDDKRWFIHITVFPSTDRISTTPILTTTSTTTTSTTTTSTTTTSTITTSTIATQKLTTHLTSSTTNRKSTVNLSKINVIDKKENETDICSEKSKSINKEKDVIIQQTGNLELSDKNITQKKLIQSIQSAVAGSMKFILPNLKNCREKINVTVDKNNLNGNMQFNYTLTVDKKHLNISKNTSVDKVIQSITDIMDEEKFKNVFQQIMKNNVPLESMELSIPNIQSLNTRKKKSSISVLLISILALVGIIVLIGIAFAFSYRKKRQQRHKLSTLHPMRRRPTKTLAKGNKSRPILTKDSTIHHNLTDTRNPYDDSIYYYLSTYAQSQIDETPAEYPFSYIHNHYLKR